MEREGNGATGSLVIMSVFAPGLSRLYSLSLAHNLLSHLAASWLAPCPHLATLHLGHNRLTSLAADMFSLSPNLGSLNLGHNNLTAWPPVSGQ